MSTRFRSAINRPAARAAFAGLAGVVMLACGEGPAAPNEKYPNVPGPAVRILVAPTTLNLEIGTQSTLLASAVDSNGRAVAATFTFTSSDPSIATIDRTNGTITAVGLGTTSLTASSATLSAIAVVTVRPLDPPAALHIAPGELILPVAGQAPLTVTAINSAGRPMPATVEWTSEDPSVATVDRVSGLVTAVGLGFTKVVATVGYVQASANILVVPPDFLIQWAITASASSEYTSDDWSAAQATGLPDVMTCADEPHAWASLEANTIEWLELTYQTPVRPSEILIKEVWATGSIVKVEVRDVAGIYHIVYEAVPTSVAGCLRDLKIPVQGVTDLVDAVRVTIDQRVRNDWNEIDAVRLTGYRNK